MSLRNPYFLDIHDEVINGTTFFRVSFSNYQIALDELNNQLQQVCDILNSQNNSQIDEKSTLSTFYLLHYIFNEMENSPKFTKARQLNGSANELLSMEGLFASRKKIEKEHVHAKDKNENNENSTGQSNSPKPN